MSDAPDTTATDREERPAVVRIGARLAGVAVVAGIAGGLMGAPFCRLQREIAFCGVFVAIVAAGAQGAEEVAPWIASRWRRGLVAFGLGLAGAALGLLAASSVEDLLAGRDLAPGGRIAALATESVEIAGLLAVLCAGVGTVVCGHAMARDLARGRRIAEQIGWHFFALFLAAFLSGVEAGAFAAVTRDADGGPQPFDDFEVGFHVLVGFSAACAAGALLFASVGPAAALADLMTRPRTVRSPTPSG